MIIGMGDYGPSLALASPAAQAHQKALGKKAPAGKLALKKPTDLVPASSGSSAMMALIEQRWPWILGGLAVLGVAFWFARSPKKGRRRRNPRRPFARRVRA
jgi:hypothetical protein